MHAVDLIATALQGAQGQPVLPCTPAPGICCITGVNGPTVPRKTLFGKSFTGGSSLKAPGSTHVGVNAYLALKYKWQRMSSWKCDGDTFHRLDRLGVRQAVLKTPFPERWAGYVTTSYKKHGALLAPVNTGLCRIWLFETRTVDCTDMETLMDWWHVLNNALRAGIGRKVLETLDIAPWLIKRTGLRAWLEFESWARPKHHSSLYAFLCYLLPSQEEMKNGK